MNPTSIEHASRPEATQYTQSPKLLIAVCTYNERDNLPQLLPRILEQVPSAKILIVDDGSPDGTAAWVEEFSLQHPQVVLLNRGAKLGLGTAILAALRFAIEHDFDWILNLDADLSHDPAAIPSLLSNAFNQPADLVIGSRYVPGGGLVNCSWKRKIVSRCANLYARTLLRISTRDCSSAFRAYRVAKIAELPLGKMRCAGYGFLEEILWWILKKNGRIFEVPITYTEREMGDSKISWREAWGTAQAIHRLFFLSLFKNG